MACSCTSTKSQPFSSLMQISTEIGSLNCCNWRKVAVLLPYNEKIIGNHFASFDGALATLRIWNVMYTQSQAVSISSKE